MSRRSPAAPRKRSAPVSADRSQRGDVVAAKETAAAASAVDLSRVDELKADLINELNGLMRSSTISDGDHDALVESFLAAFNDAVSNDSAAAHLDIASSIREGASQLKSYAAELDHDGTAGLLRQLDEALGSLERRETEIAIEFSRRLDIDGQESALAWLREQQAAEADGRNSSQVEAESYSHPEASAGEVTQSRSRRLRGPP